MLSLITSGVVQVGKRHCNESPNLSERLSDNCNNKQKLVPYINDITVMNFNACKYSLAKVQYKFGFN